MALLKISSTVAVDQKEINSPHINAIGELVATMSNGSAFLVENVDLDWHIETINSFLT